jgi:hypothetical protein
MNESPTMFLAQRSQLWISVDETVHERPPAVTRPGMHHEPRRFVDNQQVPIIESNCKIDELRLKVLSLRWDRVVECIPGTHSGRPIDGAFSDAHLAGANKALRYGAAQTG